MGRLRRSAASTSAGTAHARLYSMQEGDGIDVPAALYPEQVNTRSERLQVLQRQHLPTRPGEILPFPNQLAGRVVQMPMDVPRFFRAIVL